MNADERRLLHAFRGLSPARRVSALDYLEYLGGRADEAEAVAPATAPLDLPRPAEESVVKAIRRLTDTYPMLDRKLLLHETAALMTQHVVHKRPAAAVIDELEALFRQAYAGQVSSPAPLRDNAPHVARGES